MFVPAVAASTRSISLRVEPANRCTDGRPCEDLKPGWRLAYRLTLLDPDGELVGGSRVHVRDGITGFSSEIDLLEGVGFYETIVPDATLAGFYAMTFEPAIEGLATTAAVTRSVRITRPDSRCGPAPPDPDATSFEFPRGSGHRWLVKRTDYAMGPRANYWSDSPDNIWLDEEGQLHLRMSEREGRWYSAEVCSEESFGYGDYVFFLSSRVDQLDPSVVGALFMYESDDREIDIEFSRWGCPNAPNTQYGIQPFGTLDERTCQTYAFPRRGFRFEASLAGTLSTHRFSWHRGGVSFSSDQGHMLASEHASLAEWTYAGAVPAPNAERVHMSLWWAKNAPPVTKPAGPQELIVAAVLLPPDLR